VLSKQSLISIIDDDGSFLDSMRRLLKSLGYDVAAFRSAGQFLASPRRYSTACVIADVQMPLMTGVELYEHLVATKQAIPTILVTGFPNSQAEERMRTLGVECYLHKPLDEAVLIGCLRSACARCDGPHKNQ
jgi:FixJ family two-component response regulator